MTMNDGMSFSDTWLPSVGKISLQDIEGNLAGDQHAKNILKRELEQNIRIAAKRQQDEEMDFASKRQNEHEMIPSPPNKTLKRALPQNTRIVTKRQLEEKLIPTPAQNKVEYVDSRAQFKQQHSPSMPLKGVTQAGESSVPCHCGNTKCLRMYCGCFKRGELCSKRCTCSKCANVSVLDKRRIQAVKRVHYIKAKEWHRPAVYQDSFLDDSKLNLDANVAEGTVTRVCACVNSGCNKKYCICYRNGTKCTEICTCITCCNK